MSSVKHETSEDLEIGIGNRAMPLSKAGPIGLLLGLGCTVVSLALIYGGQGEAMLGSWLFGWYFWMTIVLGMLGLTVLHHTVRGSWALPWLKIVQAGVNPTVLGVMFLLFLPVLFQPEVLYEWVKPGTDPLLLKKQFYLNVPFFTGRTIFYFALWAVMTAFLANSVKRQEAGGGFKLEMGRSSWGAVFIVLYVLSITFAFTDWGMSLQPHWYSTMYGVWMMVGGALGASSLIVAVLCINAKKWPYTTVVTPNLTKDWGNILFMFTMVWAYTAVSQYLIIWNGNLPETASYFARRSRMGWNAIGMVTILGQFLIPWMSLLSPRIKRYPHLLRQIAGFIFAIHIIDVYLAIVPALPSGGFEGGHGLFPGQRIAFEALALVGVGGIWFGLLSYGLKKTQNLLPTYDNRLQEALNHAH